MDLDPTNTYSTDYFLGTSGSRGDFSLLELGPKFYDRTNTVIEYFDLPHAHAGTIVELGCGTAPFYRIMQEHSELRHLAVSCTDVTDKGIALLKPTERPPFSLASADHLPFESSSLLGTIAWDVLEHIENPQVALAEIYRVLAPQGFLHIVCPNPDSWQRDSSAPENDVYRRDKSHIFPAIVTVDFLSETLSQLDFTFEQFTRGFPGSEGQYQTGRVSLRPARVDNTGTHIVVFARKT